MTFAIVEELAPISCMLLAIFCRYMFPTRVAEVFVLGLSGP